MGQTPSCCGRSSKQHFLACTIRVFLLLRNLLYGYATSSFVIHTLHVILLRLIRSRKIPRTDKRHTTDDAKCMQNVNLKTSKEPYSMTLSPQANYTECATATCRRNLVPIFVDRGVSRDQRGGSPTVINLSFLDRSRYLSFK
jgi:hypothetical protein